MWREVGEGDVCYLIICTQQEGLQAMYAHVVEINLTFEKLTDTFCLRSRPSSAVTLPSKNSTITDTISVELLEYCNLYDT